MPPSAWGRAALAAAGLGLAVCRGALAAPAPAATAPMTFEELLRDERKLGVTRFSPDGARVLVAVERQDLSSQGAPWKLTATEAYVWNVATGGPRRIGGKAFAPTLCEPWSPSSRRVAGLVLKAGERRLAAWNRLTGRTVVFDPPPATQCPVWAGERLAYPTPPMGTPSAGSSSLLSAASQLARWDAAVRKDRPQVTVHSANADFPSPAAPEGGVVVADPASRRAILLAQGAFHSLAPSPDGDLLAMVRLGRADPQALSKRTGRLGELQVYHLTAGGGELVYRLPDFDADYAGLAWSADGTQLLVGGRVISTNVRALQVVTPRANAARALQVPDGVLLGEGPRGAFATMRQLGWVGPHPAFIGAVPGRAPAASDARRENGESRDRIFRLFLEGPERKVRSLTDFAGQSVTAFAATPDGEAIVVADGALWGLLADGARRRISGADHEVVGLVEARPSFGMARSYPRVAGRIAITTRDAAGAVQREVLDATSGRRLIATADSGIVAMSPRLDTILREDARGWARTLRLVGRDARELATFGAAWANRPLGEVRRLTYSVAGRTLTGWIVLPPGDVGGPRPAVAWVYGGQVLSGGSPAEARPGGAVTPVFSGQLWAAQGYAVIYPSTPLGSGADTDVAATLAEEVVAAVDAAASQGLVDPSRVGVIGHSFGGFSTAAILSARPDRFAAGVAMSGPYDFITAWGARYPLESLVDQDGYGFTEETIAYVEQGQVGLGAPPFTRPEAYVRASPFFAAAKITPPLLLTVGDQDQGSTSLLQAERMYAALVRSGNPAVLVRYWGQSHVQQDAWAVRDQWARFTAWFDRYLTRDPRSAASSPVPAARADGATRSPGPGPAPASSAPRTPSSPRG